MTAPVIAERPVAGWTAHALCPEVGGVLFFPKKGDNEGSAQAKRVCAQCRVRLLCLEDALSDENDNNGVRGGKTARARRDIRAQRRRDLKKAANRAGGAR